LTLPIPWKTATHERSEEEKATEEDEGSKRKKEEGKGSVEAIHRLD
jgi:hypothetical protein